MTSVRIQRWRLVADRLRAARESGSLGVIAASNNIAEYILHDMAKVEPGDIGERMILTSHEVTKLYDYFEGKRR